MSQLKTAWPMHFLVGSHNTLLAQSSGKEISGVLKFFNTLPQGGNLARMFQFGDILGHFFFLQIFLYASILICVTVTSVTTIYIQFF